MKKMSVLLKSLFLVGGGLLCLNAQASPVITGKLLQDGYKELKGYECVYVKIPDSEENDHLYDFPSLAIKEGFAIWLKPDVHSKVLDTLVDDMVARKTNSPIINGYVDVIDPAGYEGWIKNDLLVPYAHKSEVGYRLSKSNECTVLRGRVNPYNGNKSMYFLMWKK